VNYIHLIEKFYLKDSVETSNAYFLVGVYYFEVGSYNKAAACFQKSHAIRKITLGESH
jgi:TolA-binding protein